MKLIIFIFYFFAISCFAQPGGGGGLYITNFYDGSKKIINIKKLSIQVYSKDSLEKGNSSSFFKNDGFYIPAQNGSSNKQNLIHMDIEYENKKYRIDFENILAQNPNGDRDRMDSLVLDTPYILSKRNRNRENNIYGYAYRTYLGYFTEPLLKNGITPGTNKKLNLLGFTHFSKDYIDDKKKIPWEENFCKALSILTMNSENIESLSFFDKALEENKNQYNEPLLNFKIELELQNKNYKNIIDLITNNPKLRLISLNEDIKAESLIKLKRYDEAELEYEKLEQKYSKNNLKKLGFSYKKNKVRFYKSNYKLIINELAPYFGSNKKKINPNLEDVDYDFTLLKLNLLYAFSIFIENPNTKNLANLKSHFDLDIQYPLDRDFIEYLKSDYYMNTTITHEKFQGFKILYFLKENRMF